jgi:hypothetical protein
VDCDTGRDGVLQAIRNSLPRRRDMAERIVKDDPIEPKRIAPQPPPVREPRTGAPLAPTFKPGQNPTPIKRRK